MSSTVSSTPHTIPPVCSTTFLESSISFACILLVSLSWHLVFPEGKRCHFFFQSHAVSNLSSLMADRKSFHTVHCRHVVVITISPTLREHPLTGSGAYLDRSSRYFSTNGVYHSCCSRCHGHSAKYILNRQSIHSWLLAGCSH